MHFLFCLKQKITNYDIKMMSKRLRNDLSFESMIKSYLSIIFIYSNIHFNIILISLSWLVVLRDFILYIAWVLDYILYSDRTFRFISLVSFKIIIWRSHYILIHYSNIFFRYNFLFGCILECSKCSSSFYTCLNTTLHTNLEYYFKSVCVHYFDNDLMFIGTFVSLFYPKTHSRNFKPFLWLTLYKYLIYIYM